MLTIDVTEPTSFALFCVMESTSPVDSNVTLLPVESCSSFHASTCADTTELEEAVKYWTVVADVEATLFFLVCVHVVGSDLFQEVDVFVRVKLCHLMVRGRFSSLTVCQ